ncbi:hypothetical protein U9M48_042693 [Paspalum notatum var. saurae]|uniref:Uncharacterized protein n=1 Tax=Paspalum notatum var. saurae TaxID=547442 RepID=A0AAQ3XFN3_PASNO
MHQHPAVVSAPAVVPSPVPQVLLCVPAISTPLPAVCFSSITAFRLLSSPDARVRDPGTTSTSMARSTRPTSLLGRINSPCAASYGTSVLLESSFGVFSNSVARCYYNKIQGLKP